MLVSNANSIPDKRILIVDDDEDFADALQDVLLPEGYLVKTEYDAGAVPEIVKQFSPQVVIIDMRLGTYNGLEILQALKSHDPDAIYIMLTA